MSNETAPTRYSRMAISIHWLTALMIIGLLISGNRMDGLDDPVAKAQILIVHAPVGILIGLLTIFRIVWWWRFDTKPAPAGSTPPWQERLASLVHLAFYVIILGMVASGVGMMVLSGAGEILFGEADLALPDFNDFLPRIPHGIGAKVMLALLVLHAGAALYHQFGLKDGLLRRMWY